MELQFRFLASIDHFRHDGDDGKKQYEIIWTVDSR